MVTRIEVESEIIVEINLLEVQSWKGGTSIFYTQGHDVNWGRAEYDLDSLSWTTGGKDLGYVSRSFHPSYQWEHN